MPNVRDDHEEIERLTDEIMTVIAGGGGREAVLSLLNRLATEAGQAWDRQDAAEQIHATGLTMTPHDISLCSLSYCGRYRGQRRDSVPVTGT